MDLFTVKQWIFLLIVVMIVRDLIKFFIWLLKKLNVLSSDHEDLYKKMNNVEAEIKRITRDIPH